MGSYVYIVLVLCPFAIAIVYFVIRRDLVDEEAMVALDKILFGYVVLLLLFLSVGRAFADDQTDRDRVMRNVFEKKFSPFLEKGTFSIDGKVIFNSGFEKSVNYPQGTSVALISVTHKFGGYGQWEKDNWDYKYYDVRLTYLVVSRNGIKIDQSVKGEKPFIFDNNNNKIPFVNRKTRLDIDENTPDGIYAFASSQSTSFLSANGTYYFIMDPYKRMPGVYSRNIDAPTEKPNNFWFGNDYPLKQVDKFNYDIDYGYNVQYVNALQGDIVRGDKSLFDVEVDKIINDEKREKEAQKEDSEKQKEENNKVNQDNFGKDEKEIKEKDTKNNDFGQLWRYFVYDEEEIKKAIASTAAKIDMTKNAAQFDGKQGSPANSASLPIWEKTIDGLDGANFNSNELVGDTELGAGRVPWRSVLKYTIRMIASFAFALYVMKFKERIVSR